MCFTFFYPDPNSLYLDQQQWLWDKAVVSSDLRWRSSLAVVKQFRWQVGQAKLRRLFSTTPTTTSSTQLGRQTALTPFLIFFVCKFYIILYRNTVGLQKTDNNKKTISFHFFLHIAVWCGGHWWSRPFFTGPEPNYECGSGHGTTKKEEKTGNIL